MNADDDVAYLVVMNHEEQHSVWPAQRATPPGWRGTGFEGSRAECLNTSSRLAGLRYRRLRYLEDDLPHAVPDPEVGSRDEEQAAADRRLAAVGSVPAVSSGSPLRSRT